MFHDKSLVEGVSGEPLVRMSEAVRTGTVMGRTRFMDARLVDKQPMEPPHDSVYYFLTTPMCDVRRRKKQQGVCPRRCGLFRGENRASRALLFTPDCLPVAERFKRRG